jgi:hypothetical protein
VANLYQIAVEGALPSQISQRRKDVQLTPCSATYFVSGAIIPIWLIRLNLADTRRLAPHA